MEHAKFKNAARRHQIGFREQKINVLNNKYSTWLTDDDAMTGKNFYCGFEIFENVKDRYKIKFEKPLRGDIINKCSDMLRSEHIPFNLFIPFKKDPIFCKQVFNEILDNIESIDTIEIEYAPPHKALYLNDRTSFDTYIEYTHSDHSKGVIGIEVKYTEKEYKLANPKESREIEDKNGRYHEVTGKSNLYKSDEYIERLKKDEFRQIWRNHLLAESILLVDDTFHHAHSLIFYPKDNEHFTNVGNEYAEMLADNTDRKFGLVTYEYFIEICRKYCPNDAFKNWIDYLQDRYII
jgi:hypothetical protein